MSFLNRLGAIFAGKQILPEEKKKVEPTRITRREPQRKAPSHQDLQKIAQYTNDAKARAREIIIEAKDEAFKIKQQADEAVGSKRKELDELQQKLYRTQAEVDRKLGRLEEKEKFLEKSKEKLDADFTEVNKLKASQVEKLEKISLLTREEAKKILLEATEKKLKGEVGKMIKEAEDEAREKAEDKAREVLVDAMQHGATDYVAEFSVSSVRIPDEEIKGRVIGKEGRNIRIFEKVTGVDVDLDEEGSINLSCFDPVRREIAKVSLEKLIRDGRIQPARIEEIVEKTAEEIKKITQKAGQDLCYTVKVHNLPVDIVEMLGKFKYRYSYGQNLISHTLEVVKVGVALAQEVGANVNIVRLGCLLHDVGKVIMDEDGTHVELGSDFLRKNGIPQEVIDTVEQHHQDKEFSSVESVLVYIADAISGARPGARYEDFEAYVKRMRELEETASSFAGVKKAYAIQAGREVRVIVDPEARDDASTYKLAQDIRDKVKKELTYPGAVKVTVIREVRKTEVAN